MKTTFLSDMSSVDEFAKSVPSYKGLELANIRKELIEVWRKNDPSLDFVIEKQDTLQTQLDQYIAGIQKIKLLKPWSGRQIYAQHVEGINLSSFSGLVGLWNKSCDPINKKFFVNVWKEFFNVLAMGLIAILIFCGIAYFVESNDDVITFTMHLLSNVFMLLLMIIVWLLVSYKLSFGRQKLFIKWMVEDAKEAKKNLAKVHQYCIL